MAQQGDNNLNKLIQQGQSDRESTQQPTQPGGSRNRMSNRARADQLSTAYHMNEQIQKGWNPYQQGDLQQPTDVLPSGQRDQGQSKQKYSITRYLKEAKRTSTKEEYKRIRENLSDEQKAEYEAEQADIRRHRERKEGHLRENPPATGPQRLSDDQREQYVFPSQGQEQTDAPLVPPDKGKVHTREDLSNDETENLEKKAKKVKPSGQRLGLDTPSVAGPPHEVSEVQNPVPKGNIEQRKEKDESDIITNIEALNIYTLNRIIMNMGKNRSYSSANFVTKQQSHILTPLFSSIAEYKRLADSITPEVREKACDAYREVEKIYLNDNCSNRTLTNTIKNYYSQVGFSFIQEEK